MQTIYKYPICNANYGDSVNSITVPKSAKFLKIANQFDTICAWYLIDTEEIETRKETWFQIGSGHVYNYDSLTYIDSIINEQAALVWHMFIENGN